jgi:hypothetical protein
MNGAKTMAKEVVRIRKQREQLLATKVKLGQVGARTEVFKIILKFNLSTRLWQRTWLFRMR